jgi:hypothetical protein
VKSGRQPAKIPFSVPFQVNVFDNQGFSGGWQAKKAQNKGNWAPGTSADHVPIAGPPPGRGNGIFIPLALADGVSKFTLRLRI